MAIKPTIEKPIDRGIGKMGSELDYLKVDPTTYFYNKFKSTNKYLRDDMWTEASIRGETNTLINILSEVDKISQTNKIDTSFLDKYEFYENLGYGDYDTYLLALSLPTLDNAKKEDKLSSITGESLGSYTNREWAEMVLTSTFQRYEAEMVEAEKAKRNKLAQFGIDLGVGVASAFTNIISGVGNWLNDIYNIGEGLINLIANNGNDDSLSKRFLWAFANDTDDPSLFKQVSDFNQEISYKLAYEYSTAVNAVEAYEHGYIPNEWGEYLGYGWRTEGDKVYRGFGAFWNGVTTSIGYMIPSIMTAQIAGLAGASASTVKTIGSTAMYAGIASGNVSDTIEQSGLSYKELNAGNVLSNAIIKAGIQWGVEILLGKVLGFFSISEQLRGLGVNSVKGAARVGSSKLTAGLIAAGRGLKGAAKEGLEEVLQDVSDGIIDTFYGIGGGKLNELYKSRGEETMSFSNLLQTFLAGALTEGIVGMMYTAFWTPGKDEEGNKIEFVGERDGKVFKLGKFQSMNFARALEAMNEWNDTLNNANAKIEDKENAAMKLSTTVGTLGDVLTKFGTLDAIKANNLLMEQANNHAKAEAIAKLSDSEYAQSLYKSFLDTYNEIKGEYQTTKDTELAEKKKDSLLTKVKAALKELLPIFRKNNVDKLGDIVAPDIKTDNPNINIEQDSYSKLKNYLMKETNAEALIGVDGNIVAKAENIIFVPNQWLKDGDIAKILQGTSYNTVREAVKSELGRVQRNRILKAYAKVVGKEATLDQAMDALLFDKFFYTKILLMAEDNVRADEQSKQKAIELLSTIDKTIKQKGAGLVKAGTLEAAAYNTLLNKVYQTMRTGLIVYATHYTRLSLGEISNAVLPTDIKDEIAKHKNVIFSNQMDTVLKGKILTDQDLTLFDNNVDKFNTEFDAETIDLIKKKARSSNRIDRAEAAMMIIIASKATKYEKVSDKVVYLPTSSDGIIESEHISNLENFFGVSFAELMSGNYDPTNLAEGAKQFICPGYQHLKTEDIKANSRYKLDDNRARAACAKDVLFMLSGKTLTVGADGTLMRIIDKEHLLKDEYLGDEGNTKFIRDVIDGKITSVKDVARSGIDKRILNVPIEYVPVLVNSHFDEDTDTIKLGSRSDTFNIMHEVTHAAQKLTRAGVNSELGGKPELFQNLPTATLNNIKDYISKTFPLVYKYLNTLSTQDNRALGTPDIIYYLLEGELQANTTLTTHMFDIGFKWEENKTVLVAPTKNDKGEYIRWTMHAVVKPADVKRGQRDFRAAKTETAKAMSTEMMAKKAQLEYDSEEGVWKPKKKSTNVAEGQMSLFDGLNGSDDFNLLTDNTKVNFLNKSEDVPLTSNEAKYGLNIVKNLNIRQLTPKESFALMGVKEADFNRIAKNQSDSSLYHLAGDSIVVNPLMRIFDKMYKDGILTKPVRLIEFFAGYGSQNFALKYLGKDYESWKIAEWAIKSIQAYKDAHHYTDNTDYAKDMSKQDLIDYLVDIGVSMNYNEPVSRVSLAAKSLEDLKTIYNNIQATNNLVNIQRVTGESLDIKDTNNYDYLLTYSFPCQDLSRAGLRAGMKSGKDDNVQMTIFDDVENAVETENRTRSSMLWEVDRVLKELYEAGKPLPNVLLMENVTEVHNEQNNADFTKWQANLKKYGYTNSFADLAANDYGIPQKRVRTFMVSVLNGKSFTFPAKEPLTTTVQDLMDKNVDNKYYLSTDAKYKAFMGHNANYANNTTKNPLNSRIAATLTTSQYKRAEGGNFYSDKVKGEADLFSILHPKTTEQVEYSKNILSKLEAGEKLTKDEVNKQSSMFSEDRPIKTNKGEQLSLFDDTKYTKLESEETEAAKRYIKDWNDIYKYDHVYIKVRDAETSKSNIKYFAGKYVHKRVKDFVVSTTKDFDRLSDEIKNQIKKGTLTLTFLKNYIATTKNIKDFTFKAIAEYIYQNDEVAKLTYKQMNDLLEHLNIIVAAAKVKDGLDINAKMTPEEMISQSKEIADRAKTDNEFAEAYKHAVNFADLLGVIDSNGRKKFTPIIPDISQLNSVFFHHYNGTPDSIIDINAIGKDIAINQEGAIRTNETYGYKARKRSATNEEDEAYDIKDAVLNKTLDTTDRQDKITIIREYWYEIAGKEMEALQAKGISNLTEDDLDKIKNMARNLERKVQMLANATDEELNKEYLIAMENEVLKNPNVVPQVTEELDFVIPKLKSTPMSKAGSSLTTLGKSITNKLNAKLYKTLPDNIKEYFDAKEGYKFITSKYFDLSLDERNKLKETLQDVNDSLRTTIAEEKQKIKTSETMTKKATRLATQTERLREEKRKLAKRLEETTLENLSLRDALNEPIRNPWKIKGTDIEFNTKPNTLVDDILNTTWSKTGISKVQKVDANDKQFIASQADFYAQNREALLNATLGQIEEAADWFLNTKLEGTATQLRQFLIVRAFFFGFILEYSERGKLFANINSNIKQKVSAIYRTDISTGATMTSIHKQISANLNPFEAMASESIELDGVPIEGDLKEQLFKAMESSDVKQVQNAIDDIIAFVEKNRPAKKTVYRQAVTLRSMSMLSGPLTWLRSKVSNMVLTPMHKLTTKIGNMFFKSKSGKDQLKLNRQVTPAIQKFIREHFIDNKFFDTFINNLSKYNPSDIKEHLKGTNKKVTKEAIYANLVLKSMYNQYYNDNMFNKNKKTGQFMNDLYHKLMKVMSDNKYIREATIRYFGKLLAEHNTDITKGQITDPVMNDLSTALGLAMNDYMHSNNIFNDIEKAFAKLGDGAWFVYKWLLPFAASSWNWAKAAMKLSPLGLVRAIHNMRHLEERIAKAEADWNEGRSQISPELTEYLARRDLGAGVIGTIAYITGMILAGLGIISLEEEDYGTPKLRIGNIVVDISSIFGSSSILAGAALMTGFQEKGWGKDGWLEALNRTFDFWLADFPIMEIVEMDMYADGGFSMGWKQVESIALSYIPNFLSYLAGATYSGKLKKDTLWKRAVAKLPFFNLLLDREIDPYTGEYADDNYFYNFISRMVPYFSIDIASQNEKKTKQLGLNKRELNGTYQINGQDFTVKGKDLQAINKAYGLWNAEDLTKFYDNKMKVKVKVADNKYKELTYSQMTNEQRKSAVQTIMSNNAELAKIMAWTNSGNKYYGSANTYTTLRKRGVTKGVFKGTKGFVKSK